MIDAADAAKEAHQRLAEERDRLKEALEGEVGKNNQLQCTIEDLERAVAELNDRERKANQLLQATEAHVKAVETENTRLEKEKEEMKKDQEVTTVCCLRFPLYLYIAVCSLSLSQRQRDELRRLTEVSVLLMFGYLLLLIPPQELDAARTKCQELESDNARVSEQLSATTAERNGFENELKTSIRANEEQQTSFRRWKTNLEGQLNALRNENSSLKTLVREKVANAASEEEQALLQLQEMLHQLQETHDKLQSQCMGLEEDNGDLRTVSTQTVEFCACLLPYACFHPRHWARRMQPCLTCKIGSQAFKRRASQLPLQLRNKEPRRGKRPMSLRRNCRPANFRQRHKNRS